MCAATGAISRARAKARAHDEILGVQERESIHGGQLCVVMHLTHA